MEISLLIDQFLDGNLPYRDAVKIYQEHGTSSALKKMFLVEDSFSLRRLRIELQEVKKRIKPSQKLKPAEEVLTGLGFKIDSHFSISPTEGFKTYSASKKSGTINPVLLPEHLKAEYYKLSPLIRKMALLHARLPLLSSNEERHEAGKEIIRMARDRRRIFSRCDQFLETGRDPEPEKPALQKISLPQALNKIRLLRSQRSKLKNKPHRQEDYKDVCNQIETLEKLIQDAGAII